MLQTPEFICTKEYKRFLEFCNACKNQNYIGLCYGPAGVGKSMAAAYLAHWHIIGPEIISMQQSIRDYKNPPLGIDAFDALIYVAPVINSPSIIYSDLSSLIYTFNVLIEKSIFGEMPTPSELRLICRTKLLIIDEADRLQAKSLEQVRDFYDTRKIPIILIGMPGIERRLIRFPQLYSRIGFAHAYKPLKEKEIAFIMQSHFCSLGLSLDFNDFSDHEAIAAVTRITQGNFRLINRLLKQALRIMHVNQLSSLTKEVIEAARECLVIGNIY